MSHKRSPSVLRSFFTLVSCAALFLTLTECGGSVPPPVGTEHCGGIACTSNSGCQVAGTVPVCAILTSGTCLMTTPRECAWKLNISTSCPCMEHDVRLCNAPGDVPGVEICTATSSSSTKWATCVACPNCTP